MYLPQADAKVLVETIAGLKHDERDTALILLGDEDHPDLHKLVSTLNHAGVRFAGGVFPGLISGSRMYTRGAVVMNLPADIPPLVVKGLNREPIVIPGLDSVVRESGSASTTAIVLVDGRAPNISTFLGGLFGHLGNTVHYIGGGAGFRSFKPRPCVFSNDGAFQNAAILLFARVATRIGVRHGWKPLIGPLMATKTHRNTIIELNWRTAFPVYREIVEEDSGQKITPRTYYSIAARYPFGIVKESAEDVVRDPLAVTGQGGLVCVGEVFENVALNILKGDAPSLIQAAAQAAAECGPIDCTSVCHCLIFDCVSRSLFHGDGFVRELEEVDQQVRSLRADAVPEGALSIGEIASTGEGYVDFLNKTTVVGALCNA
jgi:hypothetical protein